MNDNAACECMTALGFPVVPDVVTMTAMSCRADGCIRKNLLIRDTGV